MAKKSRHYFKEVRLQQFRSLVALSHWQTFSAAAVALNVTRASVWQHVRSLEQQLSCTLLRTHRKRVEFTPAGEKLAAIVAPLVAGFDSVKSTFDDALGNDAPQILTIASPPSFITYELREPIARIRALFPNLQITLIERNSPAAIELLDQGGADLAIAAQPKHLPLKDSLHYSPLTVYPFTLICPPKHPMLSKRTLTFTDFTRQALILPGQTALCRQHFDATMDRAGLLDKTNIVIESNFPIMLMEYVRMNLGVALMPLPAKPPSSEWHHSGVVLRDVSALFGDEPICLIRRKGQFETPCMSTFRKLMNR